MADCREIWQLLQEQRKEHRKDEEDWRISEIFPKRRIRKSQYEIALEQKSKNRVVSSDYEYLANAKADELPDAIPPRARKLFQNIFPDAITLRAAIQYKAVTLRQGQILKEYFASDERLPAHKRWDSIGRKIGFSGKTVEREFQVLVGKFLKTNSHDLVNPELNRSCPCPRRAPAAVLPETFASVRRVEARVVRVDYGPEDHPAAPQGKRADDPLRQNSDSLESGQSALWSADTTVSKRSTER